MPMLFDGAQLRCAKGKNFCPAAFQPIETFGQRFRPIDICMLFDPVGKNNQITVKRILGHMSFDIVHGVDIACLHMRKYAGADRLLSHAASRTSASLGTEKCCLISTTEGMFF